MTRKIRMEIIDETRAAYEYRGGRVLFTPTQDPDRWQGHWVEDFAKNNLCADMKDGSNAWGATEFRFNETYNQFDGIWDYCGKGETFGWKGYR